MVDVKLALRIKYGLERLPTDAEVKDWADLTSRLQAEGESLERAGDVAAKYKLPGYKTHVLKSEAENIEALLKELQKK